MWWSAVIGCVISTTIGTFAPLMVAAGSRSIGRCSRSNGESRAGSSPGSDRTAGRAQARSTQSPTAPAARPRKPRLESSDDREAPGRLATGSPDVQCLPGSSLLPRFDQYMYASSAFMASES